MIASVRHVTYTYPGRADPALRDVSIDLDPGEFVLLVGESGSGKSTLLRLFNGLVPQFHGGRYGGEVSVAGLDPSLTPARSMATVAGMVFQEPESQGIADTVEDDVAFGMEQRAVPRAEMLARTARLLDELGIAHLRHRRLATLSGGERQRAAIASVLALEPRILLLDEPVSQLDGAGATAVATTLSGLAARGLAVVVAEHRLDHFLPRASTVWSTRQGRLFGSARPGDFAAPAPGEAVVEAPPMRSPGDVLVRARDLSVTFPGGGGISGIDLAVREGEIVALTGLNGSGKTTLLRGLTGLVRASGGSVDLAGRPAPSSLAERSAQLGYVPQDPAVVLYRETVYDELRDSLRRRRGASSPGTALDTWGLRPFADRNPRDLSVGEQQRVAIAAMLAHAPRAWLLDEPTRGADVATRTWLAERIRAQAAAGGAVVVATHDHRWATGFATRIVTLEAGRVSADVLVDASREPALASAAVAHR